MLIFIFMIVCSLAAVALAATIPSPFELNKVQQAADCYSVGPWGKVGNNGPVDVVWTDENIQHLGRSDVCKIPAKTTKRVVCKNGSAVYIRNLEDQETAYKCVNYLYSTQGVFQECSDFHRTFGPAYSDGSKWATILVGDSC